MSKNENKELNAILAQLKKSYSSDEDIEDSLSDESEDDFQKMLSSYFSDDSNKDIYKFTAAESADSESQTQESEYSLADFEEFIVEAEPAFEESVDEEIAFEDADEAVIEADAAEKSADEDTLAEEIELDECEVESKIEAESIIDEYIDEIIEKATEEEIIEEEIIEEEILEEAIIEKEIIKEADELIDEKIADDKDIVDDVFAAMFPQMTERMIEQTEDSEVDFVCESVEIIESTDENIEYIEPYEPCEACDDMAVAEIVPAEPKETVDDIFGSMDMENDGEVVLDISALIENDEEEKIPVITGIEAEEAQERQVQYLSDPLQGHLSDAAFVSYKIADDEVNFDVSEDAPELDDEEISLLLDFGYDDEAEAEVGYMRTSEIKRQRGTNIPDEESKKIYGYYGEEYTDRSQINKIKDKYARDKKELFTRTVTVLSIAVVMLLMSMVNCFSPNVNFILFTLFEMILLLAVAIIALNPLKSGFMSLIKLEPNYYSAPALVVAVTLLYDIFELIYIATTSSVMLQGTLLPCGFISALYVFAPLLAELLECTSEAATFDVITSDDKLYTAEKFNKSPDHAKPHKAFHFGLAFSGENIFEVRKTAAPHGYFGRMSRTRRNFAYVIYLIGAIFAISLIVGCVALIKVNSVAVAAYSSMTVILMGMPLSLTLFVAIPKLASTKFLKKKNCAMVSDSSVDEYCDAESIIFDDSEAVELVKKLEIRPEGDSDVAHSIKIAARALKALGGPISSAIPDSLVGESDPAPEISLAAVKDNGVELYMDSTIYMLIGDAAFMSTFGIKVSSDYNTSASSDASKRHSVIYIAIDGVPRLGYVISSKIRDDFIALMKELDKNGIKTAVASYDPSINDYYFEQNKVSGISAINVYKPDYFYNKQADLIADGGIFAVNNAKNIIYPLLEARKLQSQMKKNKLINILLSVSGCIISSLFTILVLMGDPARVFTFATLMLIFVFHIISALPPILTSFDFKKRQESEKTK